MIAAFGPIWILTALGYGVRRAGLLDDGAAAALGRFVFHLAMPAALYLTLAKLPLSGLAGPSIIAFGVSTVAVIGAGWLAAAQVFHRKPGERALWGMAAGYVNSANLGIPIAMQVLGGVSFLVEVVLLQSLVVTPIILMALDRAADPERRIRFRRLLTMPLRNPVILGSLLGITASAVHFHAPGAVTTSLSLLSASAVPAALIALGASLHRETSIDERAHGQLGVITAAKLIGQPVIAWVVGALVMQLDQPQLLAVVICAGLPTAQNTFIFASEYGIAEALSSRAVVATTALSLATLAAIAALLG